MSSHALPPSPMVSASAVSSSAGGVTVGSKLRGGLVLSALVHVGIAAAIVYWGTRPEQPRPPVYRVNLVGAPPGVRQVGVVNDRASQPSATTNTPAPSGVEQVKPPEKTVPVKQNTRAQSQARATPTPTRSRTTGSTNATRSTTAAAPPKAGSGAQGGKGADVVTVRTEGIAFPDQGYLNNIVRQLTLNWHPRQQQGTRVAEVKFTIRRDGSVTAIDVIRRSGDRSFDIEAMGAIETVGNNRLFGALPSVWTDDVLIVYFTFDYALLK